jgi:hypothetical protein
MEQKNNKMRSIKANRSKITLKILYPFLSDNEYSKTLELSPFGSLSFGNIVSWLG